MTIGLKKDKSSQQSYERWVGFLDLIGIYVGKKYQGRHAAKWIMLNISDGLYEQEQKFMATPRPQTNRPRFLDTLGMKYRFMGARLIFSRFRWLTMGDLSSCILKLLKSRRYRSLGEFYLSRVARIYGTMLN